MAGLGRQVVRRRGREALRPVAVLHQQGLDAPLVQRRERVRETRGAARVSSELALQAVEVFALAAPLVLGDDLARLAPDVLRRSPDVDVEPARDPAAQVAVERALDLAAHLLRRSDDEALHEASFR